jgi:hypothetical protein
MKEKKRNIKARTKEIANEIWNNCEIRSEKFGGKTKWKRRANIQIEIYWSKYKNESRGNYHLLQRDETNCQYPLILTNYSSENWKRHWKEKCYEKFLLIKQNEIELLNKGLDDPKIQRRENDLTRKTFSKNCTAALQKPPNLFYRYTGSKDSFVNEANQPKDVNNLCKIRKKQLETSS